ncbi:MAG: N-acetylmuramoyl-L-alanine amidase, partial [Phormidesmis sp.]
VTPEIQSFVGAIQEIRVGVLDAETTRLVVEYSEGYSVDPSQVQIRGESARQWSVQLPEATEIDGRSPISLSSDRENRVTYQSAQGASTSIQGITATADGFFIRTAGDAPQMTVNRTEEDGQRYITLMFDQAAIAPGLTRSRLPQNRYSIDSWQLDQVSTDPASVQITLALAEASPDWAISASESGIVILPEDISISDVPDQGGLAETATAEAAIAVSAPAAIASNDRLPAANREQTRQLETPRELSAGELPTLPNGRFTVVIDPGHGGRDPGAVGIGGLQEKEVVNDIAPRVAALLRQQGANVVMTRDRDIEVDLAPRVQIAERANASVFVSIHANAISMSRPDVNGLETFYASDAGQRFANTVHSTVLSEMRMRDRRVRSARFYVIRQTSMPAILIETGFVTGAEDQPNLANPAWRERMAEAIARGILIHLQRGL